MEQQTQSWGIQSIEVGGALLRAFLSTDGETTLTALAQSAGMPASKAHRYLASFIRVGLVTQKKSGGRYELGPLVSELGFSALRQLDAYAIGQEILDVLAAELDVAASLTIWTERGPAIVRWARSGRPIDAYLRLGFVLPLLTSSNGQIFAAYLPRPQTQSLMKAELADRDGGARKVGLRSMNDVEMMLTKVRETGLGRADGTNDPAVASLSAPVNDQSGRLVAALTAVGLRGTIDMSPRGLPAQVVRRSAESLSGRLGAKMSSPTLARHERG